MLRALAAVAAVRGADAASHWEQMTGRRLLQGGGLPPVPDVTAAPVTFDWGVSSDAAPSAEAARFQREINSLLDDPSSSWTQAATVRVFATPALTAPSATGLLRLEAVLRLCHVLARAVACGARDLRFLTVRVASRPQSASAQRRRHVLPPSICFAACVLRRCRSDASDSVLAWSHRCAGAGDMHYMAKLASIRPHVVPLANAVTPAAPTQHVHACAASRHASSSHFLNLQPRPRRHA